MNYGNTFGRCTALGLAAGFALASGAANAAPLEGPLFNPEALGSECIASECVNLAAGGYSIRGGGVVDPAEDKHNTYAIPGSDSGDPDDTTSFNVTSEVDDPDGAATPILVTGGFDTTVDDFGEQNIFEMYWGSVDEYNEITFSVQDFTETFTGTDLAGLVDSDAEPNAQGNFGFDQYVRFTGTFDQIELSSEDGVAFEVATAAVPVPGMLGLLGLGLVALGAAGMRRRA